jgi:hypothetical protein
MLSATAVDLCAGHAQCCTSSLLEPVALHGILLCLRLHPNLLEVTKKILLRALLCLQDS